MFQAVTGIIIIQFLSAHLTIKFLNRHDVRMLPSLFIAEIEEGIWSTEVKVSIINSLNLKMMNIIYWVSITVYL